MARMAYLNKRVFFFFFGCCCQRVRASNSNANAMLSRFSYRSTKKIKKKRRQLLVFKHVSNSVALKKKTFSLVKVLLLVDAKTENVGSQMNEMKSIENVVSNPCFMQGITWQSNTRYVCIRVT